MVLYSWSNVIRNWFSLRTQAGNVSRSSLRRRPLQFSRSVELERLEERLVLSAIMVTSTGDAIAVDGFVTLREAMESVNGGANINGDVVGIGAYGTNDTISFNISGSGVQSISPGSALPTLVNSVIIDGYSQPGASVNTSPTSDNAVVLIELNGANAGLLGVNGLLLGEGSGGSRISGLAINRFSGASILVQSDSNTIDGNFLGTDATGNVAMSVTGGFGIAIEASSNNTIGGLLPAARNIIGGNSDGINVRLDSQDTVIRGNFIGLGADGTTAVGNRSNGIALQGAQNNEIGGILPGAGNTITNSGAAGVAIFEAVLPGLSSTGNSILGNSIYHNGLLSPLTTTGIDLVASNAYPNLDGVTPNDLGDGDTGPNLLLNFPVLTSVSSDDLSTTIQGGLNSSANTPYRIEFFSTATASGTGFGEGEIYLGYVDVLTDEFGNASFSTIVATSVPNGQFVTATATGAGTSTGTAPVGGAAILGLAADFAVLAGSTVTITGPTTLIGNVGVSPGSVIAGSFTTTGTIHIADAVAANAQLALTTAYNALAGMAFTTDLTGQELGGMTLTPGIYHFDTSAQLTGPLPLILDTLGDPHALFVFQIGSTLTTAASVGSAVVVVGGPADNIYWQVGSSATIGVGTAFVGNILADQSITLATGATLASGRALARIGAVTLDSIVVDSTTVTPMQNSTSEFSAVMQILAPTISINDVSMVEGNAGTTSATFTVTLSAASGQTVTVVANSADGTASPSSDFISLPATTLTFLPGETTKTVTVAINGDILSESDETYFVNLTTPTNAILADDQGLGTIVNDDAAPSLSISDVTVLEGNAGVTNAVFTVTLSAPSGQMVTVVTSSADGTALFPSDYAALAPTTLTFLPGETTKTVTVAINGDVLSEANETFVVNLLTPTNATISDGQALGTIIDDDVVPTLSINDVTLVEGDAGTTNAVFTVSLSAISGQTVTVVATSADGTASLLSDYLALAATTLTFLPGELTQTVTVALNGDSLSEADETFFVNLTGAINATVSDNQGLGTITNDDLAPTVSINDVTVLEGDAGTSNAVFTVTLSAASGQIVTVTATSADGTGMLPEDYIAFPATTLTFLPGELTKTVTVAVNGDFVAEADETYFVNLTAPINATLADNQGVGTILDDDSAPTLSINDVTVLEGNAGTINATFTITLSAASGQAVTVVASSADGTASFPSDYIALLPTTVTFLPGETTKTVTVVVSGDFVAEGNETLFMNLTSPVNATITDSQGLGTIVNDDAAPTLSISDVTLIEGDGGTTSAVFIVTLSAASGQTVNVDATSSDGTASLLSDYAALAATTLTFLPGELTKTVTIAVNGDLVSEANETFFVNLTGEINATVADNQGLGTILNDDLGPTFTINDVTVLEGNAGTTNAVFTVTLSETSGQTVTVVASTADGTASLLADYIALPPTTLTFLPGETTKTVTVAVNGDVLPESNETFFVNLTGATNAAIADNQGLGTITDEDGPLVITSGATATVAENTPAATVVLDVNATLIVGHTLTYSLTGPDAAAFNINPATGELTFVTSPNYEVPIDQGTDNVYHVTVVVTADFIPTRSTSQDLEITVTPVNDLDPVFVNAAPTFSIPENSPVGTSVGVVSASDGDVPTQTLIYSFTSGNESGAFAINPNTGEITVADPTQLDFEGPVTAFTLNVQVMDNVNPTRSAAATVVVNVTNAEEGPTIYIPRANGIFHMGRIPAFVSPDSTFTYGDVANPDYSNAKLTVSIVTNRERRDHLNIFPKGNQPGQISVKGHKVLFGGKQIGKFTGGRGNARPDLVITFNSNATTSAVDNLMRRLNFHVDTGVGITRTVHMQVTNIAGVDSNLATRDIAVVDIR